MLLCPRDHNYTNVTAINKATQAKVQLSQVGIEPTYIRRSTVSRETPLYALTAWV